MQINKSKILMSALAHRCLDMFDIAQCRHFAEGKAQAQAGEAALQANMTQLESQWRAFEALGQDLFRHDWKADRAAAGHVPGGCRHESFADNR